LPNGAPLDDSAASRALAVSAWLVPGLVVGAVLLAIVAALWFPPGKIDEFMRENGPVENATVVWYCVALIFVWLVAHPAFDRASATATSILLIACVAKEVSLRRWLLATAGYDPGGFDAAAWPNLVAVIFLVALLVAVAWLLWRYARTAVKELPPRRPFVLTLVAAFVYVAAAQVMEHVLKTDRALGISLTIRDRACALSLEEVLEMMFPILIIIAMLQIGVRVPFPSPNRPR